MHRNTLLGCNFAEITRYSDLPGKALSLFIPFYIIMPQYFSYYAMKNIHFWRMLMRLAHEGTNRKELPQHSFTIIVKPAHLQPLH